MAISDDLNSIRTHLEEDYEALEQLGVSVEDRNIENIKDMANQIYAKFPKTSYAEGSNITLSNTLNGKLDFEDGIVGYGDTEQYSTQGYNLLPCRGSGVRFEYVNNYYQNTALEGYFLQDGITLSANTTYYFKLKLLSKPTSATTLNGYFNGTVDNSFSFTNINSLNLNEVYTKTHTPTSEETLTIRAWGNSNNDTYKFQLWITTDNSKDTFEPYTNGASPNPSYPQPIQVVRGKNIDSSTVESGSLSNGENIAHGECYRSKDYIKISPNTQYTFSVNSTANRVVISMYNSNKQFINTDGTNGYVSENGKFTTYSNCEYIRFRSYGADGQLFNTGDIQIEPGSQATSYLPYNTLEARIRGINLYNANISSRTENGLTITNLGDGIYKVNGTATANLSTALNDEFMQVSGTFRVSGCPSGGSASTYMLSAYVGYWGGGSPNIDTGSGTNITYTGNFKLRLYIKSGTVCNNLIFKPMVTTDLTKNYVDYEPYQTPQTYQLSLGDIELNAIGNYKDELIYDVDEDKVYKNAKIGEYTFTGSGTYFKNSQSDTNYLYYTAVSSKAGQGILANNLTLKAIGDINGDNSIGKVGMSEISTNPTIFYLNVGYYMSENSINGLKAFLNSNPITLYYTLATPTLTEITDTTLINQIKALYNAHSNNGTTIITSNGNLPMIIKVRGLKGES